MPNAVKYDALRVNLRVVHRNKDVLEALVQMLRHDWASVSLTDNQAVVHVPVVAQFRLELLLHTPKRQQLLRHDVRRMDVSDTAICL